MKLYKFVEDNENEDELFITILKLTEDQYNNIKSLCDFVKDTYSIEEVEYFNLLDFERINETDMNDYDDLIICAELNDYGISKIENDDLEFQTFYKRKAFNKIDPKTLLKAEDSFGFDKALNLLKENKMVARYGWNGKGMRIEFRDKVFEDQKIYNEHLLIVKDNVYNTWVPSISDLLSNDWIEIKK